MSNFISGGAVECGPSSTLKDVSSLVERDYGVQRDRYVAQPGSSAGPSAFRSRPSQPQQAAPAPNAFDVSQLRSHLPAAPHAADVHQAGSATRMWADSFPASTAAAKGKARAEVPVPQQQQPLQAGAAWGSEFQQRAPETKLAPWQRPSQAQSQPMGYMPASGMGMGMTNQMHQMHMPMPMYAQPPPMAMQQPPTHVLNNPQFAPVPPVPVQAEPQVQQEQPQHENRPQDELARTAQALVDQLGQEHSTNDKLHNSQFVQLLRGLGEGSVVVKEGTGAVEDGQEVGDGAKFVAANGGGDWASAFLNGDLTQADGETSMDSPVYDRSHQHAFEQDLWANEIQPALTMSDGASRFNKSVHFDSAAPMMGSMMPRDLNEAMQHQTAKPGAAGLWEETMEDDDDQFDTEALRQFNGPRVAADPTGVATSQHESWDELQSWDEGYATAHVEEPYLFHSANPYALGSPIVRELSPTTMGVLELEAAVQQDPRDAEAWLALGLKQQENEREDAAIRALAKATQLAPETRAAYLALAVSYTNEGRDENAHAALEKWIELGSPAGTHSQTPGESADERQARIIDSLIQIARMSPDDLDADVQVALGVLFNSSEDYAKAEDCFLAALEARPDDWVLYNRLGATLANSGRSHEAIKYYHRALALHPNFVRAQFNLGISYINLAQYRLAAQCILDAIRLQHSDVTEGYGAESAGHYTKGVTPDALWTTLRMACLHLQRPDLVTLANHHDLSGFPFEI